jgi:hypothetical protein
MAVTQRTDLITTIAGWLLFGMILLSIGSGLYTDFSPLYSAICAGFAALLTFHRISHLQKIQIALMTLIGLSAIVYAARNGGTVELLKQALSTNHALLAMLAAVSFLRLIADPETGERSALPNGIQGFFRTLLGVHFFGAVINLSAVLIVGDRLSQKKPLANFQGVTLSRGFSLAALWSPFFAAMGIALTHAPGANLVELSSHGFPIALIGLLISMIGLKSAQQIAPFEGFPWNFSSLWLPALLAVAIMIAHSFYPATSILTLIALFALSITFLKLSLKRQKTSLRNLPGHFIPHQLPRISGELTLFMAAGVLAVGISALLDAHDYAIPLDHFHTNQASLLLLTIVFLALCGIHPIISISATSSILIPIAKDLNLLGITFLMGWSLGVTASPLSAIHLTMQSRYGLSARRLLISNLPYVGLMLIINILALYFYYP